MSLSQEEILIGLLASKEIGVSKEMILIALVELKTQESREIMIEWLIAHYKEGLTQEQVFDKIEEIHMEEWDKSRK